MKRQWKMLLCLLMVLVALNSCSSPAPEDIEPVFAEATQYLGPTSLPTEPPPLEPDDFDSNDSDPQDPSVFAINPFIVNTTEEDYESMNPMSEEDTDSEDIYSEDYSAQAVYSYIDPAATPYTYAGSTPIPLDPIDMPPPTPKPELVFTYIPYNLPSLRLEFSGPAGWVPDETGNEVFVLTEPQAQVKDGQPGVIKIYASPVTSDYSESNLKTDVTQRLNELSVNFDVWDPSLTASRFLMGSRGVYANYSGTLFSGVKVGGRIHSTCIDKVLYTIEITYPLDFRNDYLNAFTEMRSSIKRQ